MKISSLLPVIALMALALGPALESSVHATVTNVAWYRLGEEYPGVVHGSMATNSIDIVSNRALTLVGGPLYDTDVAPAAPRYLFTDTNAPAVPQRYYRLRWP